MKRAGWKSINGVLHLRRKGWKYEYVFANIDINSYKRDRKLISMVVYREQGWL